MSVMAPHQITSVSIVCLAVCSDGDQRKHQSSASLAFVRGTTGHRWIPLTKAQLRGFFSIWWRHHIGLATKEQQTIIWTLIIWTLIIWSLIIWTLIIWSLIIWTLIIWSLIIWTLIIWSLIIWTLIIWSLIIWILIIWSLIIVTSHRSSTITSNLVVNSTACFGKQQRTIRHQHYMPFVKGNHCRWSVDFPAIDQ